MRSFLKSTSNLTKNSALAERFEQILSEKINTSSKSLIDQDPSLQQLHAKYYSDEEEAIAFEAAKLQNDMESKQFDYKHQKELGYSRSQSIIKVKDYNTVVNPWKGTERVQDTALRMVLDSAPKEKKIKRNKTLFTPPKRLETRVTNARQGSIDYKLSKTLSSEQKEKEEFKEAFRERLLGPAMFIDHSSSTTAAGMIGNLASARINSAINRETGKFDSPNMETVRGKPLDRERLANSTDSNFFMNQILKNQECLPVWVESQQGIDRDITIFRMNIKSKLFQAVLDFASAKVGNLEKEILKYIANSDLELLFANAKKQVLKRHSKYIETKIDDLNRGVRNYNLQCPSTSLHKWKVTQDNEIEKQIKNLTVEYDALIINHFRDSKSTENTLKKGGDSFLGILDSRVQTSNANNARGSDTNEDQYNGLGFWKLVRDAFRN